MKKVQNNKKRVLCGIVSVCLLLTMTLGMVSVSAADAAADANGDTVNVVVLKTDVAAGTKLNKDHFEVKTFKNVNIPTNVMSEAKELYNRYAKTDLYAGNYVYKKQTTETAPAIVNDDMLLQPLNAAAGTFINVTDFFPANTGKDVAALIQGLIDENPQSTLYFPDGEYLVSTPIITASDGDKATAFILSDGAVIKADKENWKNKSYKGVTIKFESGTAIAGTATVSSVIALGGKLDAQVNNSRKTGSYYYIMGGTIDGSGVADGISMEWGRESLVRNVTVKNFKTVGIEVPRGANGGSSDMDIEDCVVVGNGGASTVGIRVTAYDNTISGCRIYDCKTGVYNEGGGNIYRDIRVTFTGNSAHAISKVSGTLLGFDDKSGDNFYLHCYTQDYATGFKFGSGAFSVVDSCKAVWTRKLGTENVAFTSYGSLNTQLSNCVAVFFGKDTTNYFYKGSMGGSFKAENPIMNESLLSNTGFTSKLRGRIIPL